jgi:5'-methylthioadenosine phosphorylase
MHKKDRNNVIGMLGVTGGVGFFENEMFKEAELLTIETEFGPAEIIELEGIIFLPRHGIKSKVPPHMINHRANLSALKDKGVTKVIGMNSVGSLKQNIPPPSILIPHDYINLWDIATFHEDRIVHIVPGLDEDLRGLIISKAKEVKLEVVESGIYIQTTGPRLETKAEISMLKNFGDVVGMTMANEATLVKEMDLAYASICSVDNYANGIVEESLTNDKILTNAKVNGEKIRDFIFKITGES